MNRKGFTLIELLVVISIIGLLSSIVLAALKDARQKAEIAKFKEEMISVRNALDLYYDDNNGYPEWGFELPTLLINEPTFKKYIKELPTLPPWIMAVTEHPLWYQLNVNNGDGTFPLHCAGFEANIDGYIIYFGSNNESLNLEKLFPKLLTSSGQWYRGHDDSSNTYCVLKSTN